MLFLNGCGNTEKAQNGESIFDFGDLDTNGIREFAAFRAAEGEEEGGQLVIYWNEEAIYEAYSQLIICDLHAEYLDLDRDGREELFFCFEPMVNSAPLMEYGVLKQVGDEWKLLQMFHGENMSDNAFPISMRYGENPYTLEISCEGTQEKIFYDLKAHYEESLSQYQEGDVEYTVCDEVLQGIGYEQGKDFGGVAAWGIHVIETGMYEDRPCLIAEHGLNGINGKFDSLGRLRIFFDYDEAGMIRILDLVFVT